MSLHPIKYVGGELSLISSDSSKKIDYLSVINNNKSVIIERMDISIITGHCHWILNKSENVNSKK